MVTDLVTKTVEMSPSRPDFLFRAHKHIGTGPPSFIPDLDASFDLEFQRGFSVSDFVTLVAEHLNKTRKEKKDKSESGNMFRVDEPSTRMDTSCHRTEIWRPKLR